MKKAIVTLVTGLYRRTWWPHRSTWRSTTGQNYCSFIH